MTRRDPKPPFAAGLAVGPLRADANPRSLARRLQPGDIAVVDVLDLDRTGAEALAQRSPAAVLNVQSSISGRYPVGGASVLAAAGIPLVDEVDSAILTLREGTIVTVDVSGAPRVAGEQADAEREGAEREGAEGAGAARVTHEPDGSETAVPTASSPVSASNPVSAWWQRRQRARTARKRESLSWLDELRETEGDGEPDGLVDMKSDSKARTKAASKTATQTDTDAHTDTDTSTTVEAKPGARSPDGTGDAKSAKHDTDDAAERSDASEPAPPRRAAVTAGGLELSGRVMDEAEIEKALAGAEAGMASQLAVFTANAMSVLERSGGALLEGEGLPDPGVNLRGKHVLIVAAGYGAAQDLRAIRHYVRDRKPVVIAVSEGADIARKAKVQPAVIVGATAAVSEASLKGARTIVVHGTGASAADVGEAKLGALGREHVSSEIGVASEDLAILIAHAGGAKTIVTAGVEATLLDFLESGRVDAAGTFLARLGAGARLVDARALASVYRPRWSGVVIIGGLLLAVVALVAALWANADSRVWLQETLSALGVAS